MDDAHRNKWGGMFRMKPEREEEGAKDRSLGANLCSEGGRGKKSQVNTKGRKQGQSPQGQSRRENSEKAESPGRAISFISASVLRISCTG